MKQNVMLGVYEIIYNNGNTEYLTMNPRQLAGFKRRKGLKKTILSMKKVIDLELKIKTR